MSQQIPEGYKESTWKDEGLCLMNGKVYTYSCSLLGRHYRYLREINIHIPIRSIVEFIATPVEEAPTEVAEMFTLKYDRGALCSPSRETISNWIASRFNLTSGDRVLVTFKKLPKGDKQ